MFLKNKSSGIKNIIFIENFQTKKKRLYKGFKSKILKFMTNRIN